MDQSAHRAVPVEGIGTFTFRKRNMRAEIAISVEFARLTENVQVDPITAFFIRSIAELKVLTVEAPDKWRPDQLDDLDPFDDAVYANMAKVRGALDEDKQPFQGSGTAVSGEGEGAGG